MTTVSVGLFAPPREATEVAVDVGERVMVMVTPILEEYSVDPSYFFRSFEMELPCGAAVVVGAGVVVIVVPTSSQSDDS